MKKNCLFLSLLFTTTVFAHEPLALFGTYKVTPNWRQLTAFRVESVPKSSAGEARVQELKRDGFSCVPTALEFVRCKKFIRDEVPSARDVQQKLDEMRGLILEFAPERTVELTYQSENFSSYNITQKVNAKKAYDEHRYFASLSQGELTQKIQFLDGDTLREEYVVEDRDTLGKVVTLQKTLGNYSYEEHVLKIELKNE